MTVLIAGLSLVMTIFGGLLVAATGRAAALDARVQNAADAAALAGAAELVPGAEGDPAGAAARYARANGARLISCICRTGSTAVQVRVAIREAEAAARAVMDSSLLLPADLFSGTIGLQPEMRVAITALIRAARGKVWINSGHRSLAEQTRLWGQALERYGSPEAADDWVARPGSSLHEAGVAVDIGGDLGLARRLIDDLNLPLVAPLAHEPWHLELAATVRSP